MAPASPKRKTWDVIVVGAGIAGLSAAIYLGRGQRTTLVIDAGKSMAKWEPDVQNYLGFPEGIKGAELLRKGKRQASRYGVHFVTDEIVKAGRSGKVFTLTGRKKSYRAKFLLLATGIFHIPPDINGVRACLGHSMFFCKDCDGVRVRKKRIVIYGANNEAVDYGVGMLLYSPHISIVLDGRVPRWDQKHARWLREHRIPIYPEKIARAVCDNCQIRSLEFEGGKSVVVDALFTTRGDVFHNELAKMLKAKICEGEIFTDARQKTTVNRLYAAGCVTPANCQMIIAAGQGATAAQSINRELLTESITSRALRRSRGKQ
jgi:thioredoxin reductase (NADPH)